MRMLRDDNMPVYEMPDDPDDGSDEGDGGGGRGSQSYDRPRQSYNFAPGYRGVVYRADVPDWGAGPRSRHNEQRSKDDAGTDTVPNVEEEADKQNADTSNGEVHYKLQAMKWGLIPFWTKRNPGYGSMMKTINCRDDSLVQNGGMWGSMKARKRCIVVAQGFYEWLKKDGGREKLPHYVKRKDGKLMCFAGLWDVVQYENEGEKLYTYTIITTDSNKQLNFLHDRMPVILENGSEKLRRWLDPKRYEWSKELQSLLTPYEGELEVYPVSKDVGKVGNNSPSFIVPVDSKENKSNIANFFAKSAAKKGAKKEVEEGGEEGKDTACDGVETEQPEVKISEIGAFVAPDAKEEEGEEEETKVKLEEEGAGDEEKQEKTRTRGVKREAEDELTAQERPIKRSSATTTTNKDQGGGKGRKGAPDGKGKGGGRQTISATRNISKSPAKTSKTAGTQKITKFFANSA